MQTKQTVEEIVEQLNIIDDALFQKMAEDIGFCEEVISTILEQKVVVKEVIPQNSIKNLQGRSVILDALCVLENGEDCNIEMQKADDDNHVKRVRYNTSCITANLTNPGSKFEAVPNVIGIYISKFDMFHSGKTVYHIDRVIRETGEIQDNGLREIYVNTKVDDGTDIAELMTIFKNEDAYNFKKFPNTSKRKEQFKKNEGGKKEVCDLVENYARQYAEEVAEQAAKEAAEKATKEAAEKAAEKAAKDVAETARRFLENGVSYEVVRASIATLSEEKLQEIYKEVMGK